MPAYWWPQGVVAKITSIQNDIERFGIEVLQDRDALSLLEPKHYPHIVNAHRAIFPELSRSNALLIARTGGNPRTLMHEVADWRIVVAHPPESELDSANVDRVIDSMVRVLHLFDRNAATEVAELRTPRSTAPTDGAQPTESDVSAKRQNIKALSKRASELRRQIEEDGKRRKNQQQRAESEARAAAKDIEQEAQKEAATLKHEAKLAAEAIRRNARDQAAKDAEKLLLEAHRRADEIQAEATLAAGRTRQETERAASRSGSPQVGGESSTPKVRRNQTSSDSFRKRFKPARSGNGHLHSLAIDGWWLNCWVGRTNGLPRASVFAPTKTINGRRVEAQDTPLMESVCASEEAAFEWFREREEGGHIRREARHAIRLFEGAETDEEPALESDALDDDIPF